MSDYEKLKVRDSPRRIRPLADQRSAAFASSLRQAKEVRRQSSVVRAKAHCAFTLAEMLVSIAVLALIVAFVTQLVNSAATISTLGHKRMDADSQARQLFDRMAVDLNQMLTRNDVSYFLKAADGVATNMTGTSSTGMNDRMAFFSAGPGYLASTQQ